MHCANKLPLNIVDDLDMMTMYYNPNMDSFHSNGICAQKEFDIVKIS